MDMRQVHLGKEEEERQKLEERGILEWAHLGSVASLLNCQLECARQSDLKSGKTQT